MFINTKITQNPVFLDQFCEQIDISYSGKANGGISDLLSQI